MGNTKVGEVGFSGEMVSFLVFVYLVWANALNFSNGMNYSGFIRFQILGIIGSW